MPIRQTARSAARSAACAGGRTSALAALLAPALAAALAPGAVAQERECSRFARNAINEARQNLERRCGFSGRNWSTNYNVHFNWCMSASIGQRRQARLARQQGLRRCPGARRRTEPDRDRDRDRNDRDRNDRGRNDRGRDDRGRDDRGRDDWGRVRRVEQCRDYARTAVQQNRINRRRDCGFRGPRWSSDARRHFGWCLSANPGARRSETRARNRALARCRDRGRDRACTREYRPVCAVRRGDRRTYPNACEARQADARIIRQGPCRGERRDDPRDDARDDRWGDRRGDPRDDPRNERRDDRRGGVCRLGDVRLTVTSPGCSPRSLRVRFDRRILRNGQSVIREVNSGTIGRGHQPWGVCNFHTRIQYRCRNGRLRIGRVFRCQQARTNPAAADCSVRD